MRQHRTGYRAIAGWLLLAAVVALGAAWQRGVRGLQILDVGAALDEGYLEGFYGRELSDGHTTFRWSRPASELHLRAAPAPAALRLRALAPGAADGTPAALTLAAGDQAIGPFALAPTFRVYTLLLPTGAPPVGLRSTERRLPGDPRALGLVLDQAELRTLPGAPGQTPFAAPVRELAAFPLLPLGLLLVAAAAALAGGRQPLPGLAALTALALVAAAGRLTGAPLASAWTLTVAAGAVAAALALWRLAVGHRAHTSPPITSAPSPQPSPGAPETAATGRQSSVVGRRSSVVGSQPSPVAPEIAATGRRSWVVGRGSSVVGRQSSVVGRRSSVVGRRSSVVATAAGDRLAVAWLCAIWAVSFAAAFAPWVASDGTGYYAYTRSIMRDGDLNFGNDYREMPFPHTPRSVDELVIPATGMYVNPFSIGPGLLWLPGYLLADLFVRLGPGGYWPADGASLPYRALTMLTSALAGLVLLLAVYRIARRAAGPGVAALASLAVYFGANPAYYALREGSFASAVSAAAAALFVLAWLRLEERPSPGRWAALGAAGGLSALLYWTSALALLPAGLSFVRQLAGALRAPPGARGRLLRELGLGAALALGCGLLLVAPQLVAWQILYGRPVTVPQGTGFITPGAPVLGPFFFGALHGLLPWTPAYFVGMLGLALLALRRPWVGLCLGLGFGAYLFYNMSIPNWHGSGAFGLRRLTVLAPWCALGLAVVFERLRRAHWALPVAATALMAAWTTMLAVRYSLYLIDRDVGALEDLPIAAFLLGRDALPLDRMGAWLASGFFGEVLGLAWAGAPWPALFGLAALVAALAAGAVALAARLARQRPRGSAPARAPGQAAEAPLKRELP